MIQKIFILSVFVFVSNLTLGQCPTDYVQINSQAQLNAFVANFPSCTEIPFGIGITGPSITDLSPLSQFISSASQVNIFDTPNLTSLNGLQNIVFQPSTFLFLERNDQLASFEFAGSAASTGFNLTLGDHPLIQDLSTFPNYVSLERLRIDGANNLTDLTGFENIETITRGLTIIDNINITSLNGLNINFGNGEISFPSLSFINNPSLTNLDGFLTSVFNNEASINLTDNPSLINCSGLELITASSFFIVDNCDALVNFNGLENITNLGRINILNNDALVDFQGLENILLEAGASFKPVTIANNSVLVSMNNFSASSSDLESITIQNNPLLTTLGGLEGVNEFVGSLVIQDNESLENLDALSNSVVVAFPFSRTLSISNNPLLIDITGIEEYDLSLFTLDSEVIIENNTSLSVCNITSICNAFSNNFPSTIIIDGNASGCITELEVIDACNLDLNIVSGTVRFDFNNDGDCTIEDFECQSLLLETTDGITTFGSFTNAGGFYQNFIDIDGIVNTSVEPSSLPSGFTVSPTSVSNTFVGFGNEAIADFCVMAETPFNDLKVTLLPLDTAVPGQDSNYSLVYENIGSTLLSASTTLTFDAARQSFVTASPAPSSVTGNVITWDFASLPPFQSGEILVRMNTLPSPANEVGDIILLEAFVEDEGDESPVDNLFILEQIVSASFTINDIAVGQGEEIIQEEVGEYLSYVVRFQNLGADTAMNLQIQTMLSENLDWNTIRPLSSSHEYITSILDGDEVSFVFENIDLPSVNDDQEGSKGYIAFQARTLPSLEVGDQIQASAIITMDSEQPIETEVFTTTVVDVLGVNEFNLDLGISLYPNPVSEQLKIKTIKGIEINSVTLYSLTGREVLVTKDTIISTSHLLSGVYFVTVETNFGPFVSKVIKK